MTAGPSSKNGKVRSLADYKWEYGGSCDDNAGRFTYVLNTCMSERAWEAAAEVVMAVHSVGAAAVLPPKPLAALLAAVEGAGGITPWAGDAADVIRELLLREGDGEGA